MSSDPSNYSYRHPAGSAMTFVYDATCLKPRHGEPLTARIDWRGRGVEGAVPMGPGLHSYGAITCVLQLNGEGLKRMEAALKRMGTKRMGTGTASTRSLSPFF